MELPADSEELPFLRYWADHLLDPDDPQNGRWLEQELQQVARGRSFAGELAVHARLRGADVLDVGCQAGGLLVALAEAGARATGMDVDPALLRGAAIRVACHGVAAATVAGVAEALPFPDASFDLVTFVDVIEHVADADRALSELARVLRPGGVLWLQGPNRLSPRWLLRDPHYRMAGISVLPPALGRFWVTRVRGLPRYDVGVFPVGSRVRRRLLALGLTPLQLLAGRPVKEHGPWAAYGALSLRFGSMFTLLARKRAA